MADGYGPAYSQMPGLPPPNTPYGRAVRANVARYGPMLGPSAANLAGFAPAATAGTAAPRQTGYLQIEPGTTMTPARPRPAVAPSGNVPNAGAPLAGQTGPPMPWSATGAPASLAAAPPSAFTAANPAQQALWAQASTPQGYAQLAAQAAARPAAPPGHRIARVREEGQDFSGGGGPSTGSGQAMPPAGGALGWGGTPGLPGTQAGPAVTPAPMPQASATAAIPPPAAATAAIPPMASASAPLPPMAPAWQRTPNVSGGGPSTGSGQAMPPGGGTLGWAGAPGLAGTQAGPAAGPQRVLSDQTLAAMQPEDILGIVGRQDLTDADRAALDQRLTQMQLQQY